MNLTNYRKVEPLEVAQKLLKELKTNKKTKIDIDWSAIEVMENFLDDEYLIVHQYKPSKSNPLWRLTSPFFLIFMILLYFVMPFKWLFTGNAYYSQDKWVLLFLDNWKNLMGL